MRPDIQRQVEEESAEERAKCQERRARVLAHPDIAAELLKPPFSASNPLFWSGYIPPAYHQGHHNDSPIRKQLIAICNMVAEREGDTTRNVANEPRMITDPQLTKLHICLEECGYIERDEKLYFLSSFTQRPIDSSKKLTLQEAGRIITKLSEIVIQDERSKLDAANQPDPKPEGTEPPVADDRPAGTVLVDGEEPREPDGSAELAGATVGEDGADLGPGEEGGEERRPADDPPY